MINFNKSVIYSIINSIDYSGASVVSKTILNKEHGDITLFAMTKGQCLNDYVRSHDSLVQVVTGQAEFNIEGDIYTLKANESIIIPANAKHIVNAIDNSKMALSMILNN